MYDIERNVIYGMYSGLALLLDVYRPQAPNGIGLIHICGSGWSAPLSLDARPLNQAAHVRLEGIPLVEAGYTLFSINHRATPRFHFPAALEDAQRAVRFVRHHAEEYGIAADRIGAIGGSSGGHLVAMLGVLAGNGDADSDSEIDRLSAKVQAVVARAPALDLFSLAGNFIPLLNVSLSAEAESGSAESRITRQASPTFHVTPDCCPFLLFHGEADDIVPCADTEAFAGKLRDCGVDVECVVVAGAGHGPHLPGAPPDFTMVDHSCPFLDRHLLREE
jgi:acetyl esterase/lipase